jgi:hypothetical protein
MSESTTALVQIEAARRALALARSVPDLLDVRDKLSAIHYYTKQRSDSLDVQNHAAELKLRAERRLGELLAGQTVKGGERHKSPDGICERRPTLPDGVSPNQSSAWQRIAALPEEHFERHLAQTKEAGGELTTAGVVQLARALRRQERSADRPPLPPLVEGEGTAEAVLAGRASWSVAWADCLDFLAQLPADSVPHVLGSPPYEDARSYLEGGEDPGVARTTEEWVTWMTEVYKAALKCCVGLVAFVVAGRTKNYAWTASPALLMAALVKEGVTLRCPPIYHRVGIPGSGGPDWLRNDYELIVCATRGGELPWSDNVAMGKPPAYEPGGNPSHRRQDGSRVNAYATAEERGRVGAHRARVQAGREYRPPEIANPGNVIRCNVGGGQMGGDDYASQNEAPFPESLVEFFVKSFCPPGGVVVDPFSGSGTTGAVAVRLGRRFLGCDVRQSQVELSRRRIASVAVEAG